MVQTPMTEHEYRNAIMDSTRWDAFVPRDSDILICTAYKAGTTWTQMICALLIFQTPDLPLPLAEISPWFELRAYEFDDLLARYEAQTHRRFIKTHTPLDGLPYYPRATYLYCARDPRDVFISMQHHRENQNVAQMVERAARRGEVRPPPPELPESIDERFQLWLSKGAFPWEQDGFPYWSALHHAQTFWAHRDLPNLHFLHYADLQRDLAGQMRRIAAILHIEVDEARWPALVEAATFAAMKRNADRVAPDTDLSMWHDNSKFFHRGQSAQWRGVLSAASLELYERVKRERLPAPLARWIEEGSLAMGDPKGL
jgi:aryl sulfotransferase